MSLMRKKCIGVCVAVLVMLMVIGITYVAKNNTMVVSTKEFSARESSSSLVDVNSNLINDVPLFSEIDGDADNSTSALLSMTSQMLNKGLSISKINKMQQSVVETDDGEGLKTVVNGTMVDDEHILLYSSFDDDVLKDDKTNQAYTVNGTVYKSTTQVKNGTGSAYFTGAAGQRLRLYNPNLNFGTKDFTVEFWLYAETQVMKYPNIFGDEGNVSVRFFIDDPGNNKNVCLAAYASTHIINTNSSCPKNVWTKYTVERYDGIIYIYENDILIGQTSSSYLSVVEDLSQLAIGGNKDTGNTAYKGYMDDFTIYDIAVNHTNYTNANIKKVNTEISINAKEEYLEIGEQYNLAINCTNLEPEQCEDLNLTINDFNFISDNENIVVVDSNGVITAKANGDAIITAYNEEYNITFGIKVKVGMTEYYQILEKHKVLYSSFDDTVLKDEKTNQPYTVNGSVSKSTTQVKNGTGSAYFTGAAGQRLRLDNPNLNFGTKDFTVEFWLYAETQVVQYPNIFGDEGNVSVRFFIDDPGNNKNVTLSAYASTRIINTNSSCPKNVWTKYTVERYDGIIYIYENDILIGQTSSSYLSVVEDLSQLAIGGNKDTGNTAYKGYMDDFTIYDVAINHGKQKQYKVNYRNEYIKIEESIDIDVIEEIFGEEVATEQGNWIWESSNEDVAIVDENSGVVTGKSVGQTTITGYNQIETSKVRVIINVYRNKEGAITVPQVQEGEGFTVVLKEDGTVWTAGLNNKGQLGDGTTVNKNTLVQVKIDENTYLKNVKKISTAFSGTMALTRDGKVYVWGENSASKFGLGGISTISYAREVTTINNIIDIALAHYNGYVLDSDGQVYGSGENQGMVGYTGSTNVFVKFTSLMNVINLEAGYDNLICMVSNGDILTGGKNERGAVGNGTISNKAEIYRIGNDIVQIDAGGFSSYILKEDNTVWGTGYNGNGQLGVGDTTNRTIFTQMMFDSNTPVKAIDIYAGDAGLMFKGLDGKSYVTGYNGYGQIGDKTKTNAVYPTIIKNGDGTEATDILTMSGGRRYYENNSRNNTFIRNDGTVWIAGDNTYGQFGNNTNTASTYFSLLGENEYGTNYKNEYIKIGKQIDIDVTIKAFNVFIEEGEVEESNWSYESLDENIATVDNTGIVTGNSVGSVIIKTTNISTGQSFQIRITVFGNGNIAQPKVVGGYGFFVALKADGTVWTWGRNKYGQLGLDDTVNRTVPTKTNMEDVIDIAVGDASTAILKSDGTVWTCGDNTNKQLGNGTTTNSSNFVQVKDGADTYLRNIVAISSGRGTLYALSSNGEVYAWGRNSEYELGNGTTTDSSIAIKIPNVKNIIQIHAGIYYVLMLSADGTVWALGSNGNGQLGNGTTNNNTIAKQVLSQDGKKCINASKRNFCRI